MDVGIILTHIICTGQIKSLLNSTLAFDSTQFFPSLNHQLLLLILVEVGFDSRILSFFSNYLVDRKTNYHQNNFFSPSFNIGVSVGQGSALLPILSILYLSFIFHIFKKRIKNLKISVSLISFVNDGLIVFQNTSLAVLNFHLFCSYYIIFLLFKQFELIIEYEKTKIFHFSRLYGCFESSSLNLITLGGLIL